MSEMTFPVHQYDNNNSSGTGCSVTGGFVYRGCRFPELYGHYIYTDYCSGRIWSLTPDGAGGWANVELINSTNNDFSSFGENKNGELFLAGLVSGNIYRVSEKTSSFTYELTAVQPVCPSEPEGSIALNFTGSNDPVQVAWSNGSSGLQIADLTPGEYTVTITGGNGCTATENILLQSQIQHDVTFTNESCPGYLDGIIEIKVTGNVEPVDYAIVGPNGPSSDVYLMAGTYYITITADEGCTILDTVEVGLNFPFDLPVITVKDDSVLIATPGFPSYQWLLDGQTITGATDSVYIAKTNGEYTVEVVSDDGCIGLAEPVSVVLTFTLEALGLSYLSLKPNPFEHSVRLDMAGLKPLDLTLSFSDAKGQIVLQETVKLADSFGKTFNLRDLPTGIYFIKLKTSRGEWVERIVKK
jgi:hypothetical protein